MFKYNLSVDQSIVLFFLLATLLIGVIASKSVNSFRDYVLSKNRYDLVAISFTLIATMVGGASTSGTIAEIYDHGIVYAIASTGFIFGIILLAKFIAPNFDDRFDGMVSSSDMVKKYFGYKAEKLSALVSCIQCLGTISAQVVVLGHLCNIFFGISYEKSAVIMGSIITAYSLVGGIRAVTNTDIFQFIMIFIAFPIIANISVSRAGGILEIFSQLPEKYTLIFESQDFTRHLFLFLFWATPFSLIYPVIIHRLLMAKSSSDIIKMSYAYALFKIVILIVLIAIGFSALILYPNINSKSIVPVIIKELLPIGFSGIAISGIIAVTMSSADSFLNTASTILTKNLGNSNKLKIVKLNTLALGIIAIIIATQDYNIITVSVIMNTLIYLSVSIPLFFVIMKIQIQNYIYWLSMIMSSIVFVISGYFYKLGYESCFFAEITCLLTYIAFILSKVKIIKKVKQAIRVLFKIDFKELFIRYLLALKKGGEEFLLETYDLTKQQYLEFGIFFCVTYLSSCFMWVTQITDNNIIILRVISGLLPMGLLIRNKLNSILSQKLFGIYWYINLIVCLPLLSTVIFFLEGDNLAGIVNVCFSIFLLSILVSWKLFVILSFMGVALGYLYLNIFLGNAGVIKAKEIYILSYLLFISITIGLTFSRNKEINILEKFRKMKYMGMQIAHEVRVPLSDVSISIQIIRKIFSKIIPNAHKEKIILEMNKEEFTILNDTIDNCPDKVRIGSDIVTNLLFSLKKGILVSGSDYCSVKEILNEITKAYKSQIKFDRKGNKDIKFYGSRLHMLHCFHNIIKNAIKYGSVNDRSQLNIYLENNLLVFKDSGSGILIKDQERIFEAYYTSSNTGIGLGLAFCKDVMESINGDIKCESKPNKGTKIILIYPRLHT